MQSENQALWGEIGSLRQKHAKQQQIVSKLMEFLLQFITANSAHPQEHSVEQQAPHEVLTTDPFHSEQTQTQHHPNEPDSPTTLKRKHAALTHNEEPNKRTRQQPQQQQQPPPFAGRQQSVTINELTDNDSASGWPHTSNTPPLVDLVPSPPVPTQNTDDYQPQQQTDYRWTNPTNDLLNSTGHNQRNQTFRTVGNGDNVSNTHIPDFYLRTDNPTATKPDGTNSTGINTVTIDAECCIPFI